METIVTLYILNGIALTVVRYHRLHLLHKWKKGHLPWNVLLACKEYNYIGVRKLNPSVKIGQHPGLFKKDD